ncbi:unnamed protein product, partial [Mesorhabditis spiculigera]
MSSLPVECCELYMDESMALIPLIGEDVCLASVQSVESWVWPETTGETCPITTPQQPDQQFDRLRGTVLQRRANCSSSSTSSSLSKSCSKRLLRLDAVTAPAAAATSCSIAPATTCPPCYPQSYFGAYPIMQAHGGNGNYCQLDQPAQQHFINNPQYSSYSTVSPSASLCQSAPSPSLALSPPHLQDLDLTLLEQELAPYQCPPAYPDSPVEPIPFLDDLILSVRTEIEATKELDLSPSQSAVPSPAVSRKRSIDEDSSSQSETSDEDLPRPKRKPISLASLTREEAAARKREQNRVAALRYREKQRKSKKGEIREVDHLIARNEFLAAESIRLEKEVRALRASLYSQFGIPLPPSSTSS